jgi:3-oxoacyl-[acyl-carrier-protein] synthase-3
VREAPVLAEARTPVLPRRPGINAGVLGLGTALPQGVVSTAQIAERLGLTEDWIVSRTGIRNRRIAAPHERLSDLAAEAGAAALADAGVRADDVDLVLVATFTPDELTPNTAPLVAGALGATRAGALDVGAACTGFVGALAAGGAQIESGRAHRVLVIGADFVSRVTDVDDRRTAALFSDAAGAVVLGPDADGVLGPVLLRYDHEGAPAIVATRERGVLEMDGHETFKHAVARLAEITHEALAEAGLGIEDIDLFAYHQANARITKAVGQRIGAPEHRVVDCIGELGNSSAATIPVALATAREDGRLRRGDLVLLAAFGAGFTWGAGVLEW